MVEKALNTKLDKQQQKIMKGNLIDLNEDDFVHGDGEQDEHHSSNGKSDYEESVSRTTSTPSREERGGLSRD